MKKLQALYNEDANKIIKEATQNKNAIKNLNFLIDLAMVTSDAITMQTLMQYVKKQLKRNLPTLASNRYGIRQAKSLCIPI